MISSKNRYEFQASLSAHNTIREVNYLVHNINKNIKHLCVL